MTMLDLLGSAAVHALSRKITLAWAAHKKRTR